jgi:adenylate cyclase, class 2
MSPTPVIKEMSLEIEVKLACDDLDRLRKAGYDLKLDKPRHFEDNWLLDFEDESLFKQGAALRVRMVNESGTVTYKGIVKETHESPLKVREEIETNVTDPQKMIELFEHLGFRRSFRYQKYRTGYRVSQDGAEFKVVLDETPMGRFIEIEGDESDVLKALQAAGFSAKEIIRQSYPELQEARCKARGVPLEDLVFK